MLQFVWLSSFLFTAQAEPPSMAEILRTLPPLGYSIPYVYQVSRDEIEVVQEKLVDRVDSLRFFPLLGWGSAPSLSLEMHRLFRRKNGAELSPSTSR